MAYYPDNFSDQESFLI